MFFSCKQNNSKVAFTLAEVLITLGVIGIVAAITLPQLVHNYQKSVLLNSFKREYAAYNEGFRQMLAAEGVDRFEDTQFYMAVKDAPDDQTDARVHKEYMEKYFKSIVHVPYSTQVSQGFLSGNTIATGDECKKWVGKGSAWSLMKDSKHRCQGLRQEIFKSANGSMIRMALFPNSYDDLPQAEGSLKHPVGEFTLDVNGEKGPNQFGRDAFEFVIGQNGMLYPLFGKDWYLYANAKNGSDTPNVYWKTCAPKYTANCTDPNFIHGAGCGARIIEEGWVMNY